jgi:hypothetical protein
MSPLLDESTIVQLAGKILAHNLRKSHKTFGPRQA